MERCQIFFLGQFRCGITFIVENIYMVLTCGFIDDKYDISVINVLWCLISEFFCWIK